MTIEAEIRARLLDDYKDRTGDYCAREIPRDLEPEMREYPATILQYGMSPSDYLAMLSRQNYRCAICGEARGKRALHVDHCHESGKVRGLVCHGCNIAIGMIKEDAETARAIGAYLDRHLLSSK
jgi:hypothetical protein